MDRSCYRFVAFIKILFLLCMNYLCLYLEYEIGGALQRRQGLINTIAITLKLVDTATKHPEIYSSNL
jgi:hypothetical protein